MQVWLDKHNHMYSPRRCYQGAESDRCVQGHRVINLTLLCVRPHFYLYVIASSFQNWARVFVQSATFSQNWIWQYFSHTLGQFCLYHSSLCCSILCLHSLIVHGRDDHPWSTSDLVCGLKASCWLLWPPDSLRYSGFPSFDCLEGEVMVSRCHWLKSSTYSPEWPSAEHTALSLSKWEWARKESGFLILIERFSHWSCEKYILEIPLMSHFHSIQWQGSESFCPAGSLLQMQVSTHFLNGL